MWAFIRKLALYFLVGFVVSFIVYLFVQFDANDVLLGVVIATGVGIALAAGLWWAERHFDNPGPSGTAH